MTSQDPQDAGRGRAAELLAAVRAVESGERTADSFFADRVPRPPVRAASPAPASRPPGPGPKDPAGPVVVPDGLPELLVRGGAPETLAAAAVETFGEGAAELLAADPWRLLSLPSVRPEQADAFARGLLGPDCGPGDERRARALTGWLLERAALLGHTALDPGVLGGQLARHSVPDPDEAVRAAIDGGEVLVFEEGLDALEAPGRPAEADSPGDTPPEEPERPVRLLVGLDRYALAEESLADALARVRSTFRAPGTATADGGPAEAVTAWEMAAAARKGSAAELIRTAAGHGLVLHTGGEAARAEPAALVAAARAMGLRVHAVAHTDDGAARLADMITADPAWADGADAAAEAEEADRVDPDGRAQAPPPAGTVAALLSGRGGPARDADGLWELDLLVVGDAPQLDVETAAALAESVPDGARLVLTGDPLGLGSAGPGLVFGDLVAADVCPRVVSRTPDPGPLGELVSGVGAGELLEVAAPGKEVVIVPVRDARDAVHRTVQLIADSVPRAIGVPAEETLVITPGHGGDAGTRALNAALKARLAPGPGRFGGFDPGDRVAHTPAPGRTALGTVESGDATALRLALPSGTVAVPPERVERTVRHGWAVTAHQAVGLRPSAAVVVLPGDAADALTREWVYTAFGRPSRHLSVVQGVGAALPQAVSGTAAAPRTTRLRTLLTRAARAADAPGTPGGA